LKKNKGTKMINFPGKKKDVSIEVLIRIIWVSSFLAMIFTLPPLGLFWEFIF